MSKRTCAYCGKSDCRCKYRYGRMGDLSMQISNIAEQTTVAEAREQFERIFSGLKPDSKCTFLFSITKLDPLKLSKAKRITYLTPSEENDE